MADFVKITDADAGEIFVSVAQIKRVDFKPMYPKVVKGRTGQNIPSGDPVPAASVHIVSEAAGVFLQTTVPDEIAIIRSVVGAGTEVLKAGKAAKD